MPRVQQPLGVDEKEMKMRSYKAADKLARNMLRSDTVTNDSVLACLRRLPFSQNRLRRNVMPATASHVYSQCAGLTMSKFKGEKCAAQSRIASRCPHLLELLCRYMRLAEKTAEECRRRSAKDAAGGTECGSGGGDGVGGGEMSGLVHLHGAFAFTSITLNYNYAAKPHRDASHVNG